jgi:multimeric flavodoxin WrbA
MSKGYTLQILEPFVEGMRKVKAEANLIYASKLNIKPCVVGNKTNIKPRLCKSLQ